ncbi:MAG: transglycosylase SLT domain-containing protein, partial [Candidatus Hodarchaeales archaeon]
MTQESGGKADAVSPKNARGVMQIMPDTGRMIAKQMGEEFSLEKLHDPDTNVRWGTFHYNDLLKKYGTHAKALAVYHGGPDAIMKDGTIDPNRGDGIIKTFNYSANVLKRAEGIKPGKAQPKVQLTKQPETLQSRDDELSNLLFPVQDELQPLPLSKEPIQEVPEQITEPEPTPLEQITVPAQELEQEPVLEPVQKPIQPGLEVSQPSTTEITAQELDTPTSADLEKIFTSTDTTPPAEIPKVQGKKALAEGGKQVGRAFGGMFKGIGKAREQQQIKAIKMIEEEKLSGKSILSDKELDDLLGSVKEEKEVTKRTAEVGEKILKSKILKPDEDFKKAPGLVGYVQDVIMMVPQVVGAAIATGVAGPGGGLVFTGTQIA